MRRRSIGAFVRMRFGRTIRSESRSLGFARDENSGDLRVAQEFTQEKRQEREGRVNNGRVQQCARNYNNCR